MTSSATTRKLLALCLACLASLAIAPARAADRTSAERAIEAVATGAATFTDLLTRTGTMTPWMAKGSSGRHAKPKGGRSLH